MYYRFNGQFHYRYVNQFSVANTTLRNYKNLIVKYNLKLYWYGGFYVFKSIQRSNQLL